MYAGSIPHDRIIEAFSRAVPGSYVRDYRDKGGFITICRDYRDIKWKEQLSAPPVYRQVPAVTLVSIPRGNVTATTYYRSLALERTGWRKQFREAMKHLTHQQMLQITKSLGVGEVFPGVR